MTCHSDGLHPIVVMASNLVAMASNLEAIYLDNNFPKKKFFSTEVAWKFVHASLQVLSRRMLVQGWPCWPSFSLLHDWRMLG